MITYWQQENGRLLKREQEELDPQLNTWVDARSVTREDIRTLEEEYHIEQEHILDILDPDELSRIEREDDYILTIARIPVFVPSGDISYFTAPLGIVVHNRVIITICWTDCEMLKDIATNRMKGLNLADFPAFIVKILSRADTMFLRYLKEINPDIKIVAVEPKKSPVLSGGKANSHGLQGIGANFVPKILDISIIDEIIGVEDKDAFDACRTLFKTEGIFAGISSGAAIVAATEIAKREENKNKNIVVILPDSGTRYLSTGIFNKEG